MIVLRYRDVALVVYLAATAGAVQGWIAGSVAGVGLAPLLLLQLVGVAVVAAQLLCARRDQRRQARNVAMPWVHHNGPRASRVEEALRAGVLRDAELPVGVNPEPPRGEKPPAPPAPPRVR